MDSCIIKNECIDEMAEEMGVVDQVSAITAKAMEGLYNFDQALVERLALLKGMTIDKLERVWTRIELNPGAYCMIQTLKHLGYRIALASGGFTYFSYRIASRLGIDYAFSNELEIVNGQLTGNVIGPIVNGERKLEILKHLADSFGQEATISMGDGSNDRFMVGWSHLGIAYHAKQILKSATPFHINHTPLQTLCLFLPECATLLLSPTSTSQSIHTLPCNDALMSQYSAQ
eukprot:gene21340-25633_t